MTQVTWATQVGFPSPAWCFSWFRWVLTLPQQRCIRYRQLVLACSVVNQQMMSPPQVIYKKFNISCPLDSNHNNITFVNITAVNDRVVVNGTDDSCEAKMFTVNSQVREKTFLCIFITRSTDACRLWHERWFPGLLSDPWCGLLSDSVHHPHSGLCFCLPPRGATHLHWTARVRPKSNELPHWWEVSVKITWFFCHPFHQCHKETYAGCGQHLHPGHVRHVPANCSVWLPHVLW